MSPSLSPAQPTADCRPATGDRVDEHNMAISSTASSPGYIARDEINPSTYSFTTALKALQARTVYSWEYIPTNGVVTLSSKWNEAEKYIINPLSGFSLVESKKALRAVEDGSENQGCRGSSRFCCTVS